MHEEAGEGVTVHSYHGAMHCLMYTGEHGAFPGFEQVRLLATEYQCPEERNRNIQGLYGLLYCPYLRGVGGWGCGWF